MDNDRRREALRVRFTADVEADASEVGGGGGGEGGEGGGGGGGGVEAGGEPMIFYTITYINIQNRITEKRISHKFFLEGKSIILLNKTPPQKETRQINQRTPKDW